MGGIARAGRAQCGLLTRRAKATSARDRTTYGRARNSTRLFYLHHTRLIAKAAVVNDAMGIREQVQAACASESAPRTRLRAAGPRGAAPLHRARG